MNRACIVFLFIVHDVEPPPTQRVVVGEPYFCVDNRYQMIYNCDTGGEMHVR